jgi:hypothetical protein
MQPVQFRNDIYGRNVIVSYHSYLIIDLIRYLSLFTVTIYMYFKYLLTFMNWENSDKQPSVAEFANSPRSLKLSSSQNEHITRAIVEMVVLDYMPLKLVEGKGFLKLHISFKIRSSFRLWWRHFVMKLQTFQLQVN